MQFNILDLNAMAHRTGWFMFAENKGNQDKKLESSSLFLPTHFYHDLKTP